MSHAKREGIFMNFFRVIFFGVLLTSGLQLKADINEEEIHKTQIVASKVLQIIEEQPDAIEDWVEDRIYLSPQRITITRQGAFLYQKASAILLPPFAMDQKGIFIQCKKEDVSQEAQEHYDRATEALIDALGHSMGAGLTIECPPLAIYEGYKAVEAWKEAAREYNAGVAAERNDTSDAAGTGTCPSGPDRDR